MNWSRREELNTPSADYRSAALTLSYTGKKRSENAGRLNHIPNSTIVSNNSEGRSRSNLSVNTTPLFSHVR